MRLSRVAKQDFSETVEDSISGTMGKSDLASWHKRRGRKRGGWETSAESRESRAKAQGIED